jgi:hypothetical protein
MSFPQSFAESAAAVVNLGADAAALAALPDDDLLAAHALLSVHRQQADTYAAWLAGEIARRSQHELGYSGLAQRKGFGSPAGLVESLGQASRAEAGTLVELGTLMVDAAAPGSDTALAPWQAALARALAGSSLSLGSADAIRRGLDGLVGHAPDDALTAAVDQLLAESRTLTVDQLFTRARTLRDRIDEQGIARREKQRRDNRFLKRWIRADGMYQGSFVLDPEAGREVFSALDTIVAPRRGGPRFVDEAEKARAQAIVDDERSDDQLLADAFVEMIRLAVAADPGTLFGSRRPAVRVLVTERTLASDGGHGYVEGDDQPISRASVDRQLCDTGVVGVKFDDDGQCVNVGRERRLFTDRQRVGITARDGGCLIGGCTRPPSHCETHHINEWHRDKGRTDIADGVLLCRFHHMFLHNNDWRIVRDGGRYWLKPPRSEDPEQRLRPLPSKSPIMSELRL